MKQKYLILFLTAFYSCHCEAQNDFRTRDSDFQFGIGTKLNIELSCEFSQAFKISLTSGIGYNLNKIGMFPSIHAGVLFFNKGSIGADQSKKWYRIQSHFYVNSQISAKFDDKDFDYNLRNVPLYHFSEFNANPLQNPYKSSITYGANWIFVQNKKSQRTGFFNLNIAGRVQISYYNDGGPILKWAGDKRDRYYTGGVVLSYHGNLKDDVNLIELSYHKYTGYQKYAFDVADKLQLDYLNYHDENQFSYNQQRWRLNISNINTGYGGSLSIYNLNSIDVQDFLHFNTNVPYHPDYYRGYRWMLGGRYEYNQITLPK
jgi:hypothetical protein